MQLHAIAFKSLLYTVYRESHQSMLIFRELAAKAISTLLILVLLAPVLWPSWYLWCDSLVCWEKMFFFICRTNVLKHSFVTEGIYAASEKFSYFSIKRPSLAYKQTSQGPATAKLKYLNYSEKQCICKEKIWASIEPSSKLFLGKLIM